MIIECSRFNSEDVIMMPTGLHEFLERGLRSPENPRAHSVLTIEQYLSELSSKRGRGTTLELPLIDRRLGIVLHGQIFTHESVAATFGKIALTQQDYLPQDQWGWFEFNIEVGDLVGGIFKGPDRHIRLDTYLDAFFSNGWFVSSARYNSEPICVCSKTRQMDQIDLAILHLLNCRDFQKI